GQCQGNGRPRGGDGRAASSSGIAHSHHVNERVRGVVHSEGDDSRPGGKLEPPRAGRRATLVFAPQVEYRLHPSAWTSAPVFMTPAGAAGKPFQRGWERDGGNHDG